MVGLEQGRCPSTQYIYGAAIVNSTANNNTKAPSLLLAYACLPLASQIVPPAHALLTAGDPIKNAQAILRLALPIDNKPIRDVQVGEGGCAGAWARAANV